MLHAQGNNIQGTDGIKESGDAPQDCGGIQMGENTDFHFKGTTNISSETRAVFNSLIPVPMELVISAADYTLIMISRYSMAIRPIGLSPPLCLARKPMKVRSI